MEGRERGLFVIDDLADATFHRLIGRSVEFLHDPAAHTRPLSDALIGILFTRTSTRTRTAFSAAVHRLGGTFIAYGQEDLQLRTGESIADTGRVLGEMLDAVVARTAGPTGDMRAMSAAGDLTVVNAMSAEEHPTQALADVAALVAQLGAVDGIRVLYVGEGNNTATALASALARVPGAHLTCATPRGYGVPKAYLLSADQRGAAVGATIVQTHDLAGVTGSFDVVYTTRWRTTGTTKPDADWRQVFRPFYVDEALLDRWPGALFMHDLPAHRGEEVAGAVLDGPRSIAWLQVRMKLASAMAVMEWLPGAPGKHDR